MLTITKQSGTRQYPTSISVTVDIDNAKRCSTGVGWATGMVGAEKVFLSVDPQEKSDA